MNKTIQEAFSPCKRHAIQKKRFLHQKRDYQRACRAEASLWVTFSPFPGTAAVVFHGNLMSWKAAPFGVLRRVCSSSLLDVLLCDLGAAPELLCASWVSPVR